MTTLHVLCFWLSQSWMAFLVVGAIAAFLYACATGWCSTVNWDALGDSLWVVVFGLLVLVCGIASRLYEPHLAQLNASWGCWTFGWAFPWWPECDSNLVYVADAFTALVLLPLVLCVCLKVSPLNFAIATCGAIALTVMTAAACVLLLVLALLVTPVLFLIAWLERGRNSDSPAQCDCNKTVTKMIYSVNPLRCPKCGKLWRRK